MNRTKVVGLCAGILVLASCGKENKSSAKAATSDPTPRVEVAQVVTQKLAMTVHLPGEIEPYEVVSIFPKVTGFVKWIGVDRGSRVRTGQLIVRLEAQELLSQRAEVQSKLQAVEAQLAAVQAKVT